METKKWLYGWILLLPTLACSLVDGTLQETAEPTHAATTSEATTPESGILSHVTPLPLSAEPGMACFGTWGYGLSCLTSDGWLTTTQADGLADDAIYDMAVCPDGRLLLLHSSAITASSGKTWQIIEGGWGFNNPEAIVCTASGDIWVAHFEGVSYFDGAEWRTYSADLLATGEAANRLVYDVAEAPDGTVWVVTSNSLARFQAGNWTIYQQGQGFEALYFFAALTIDGNGRPWAAHSRGLLTLAGGNWLAFDNPDLFTVESVTIDRQNRLWVGTFSTGVSVFDGNTWTTYNRETAGLSSGRIRAMTADGQGRVWLATDWGLNVFDGASWHTYHMHTADLADNNLYSLVVINGGPPLPTTAEKTAGTLAGELVDHTHRPIADAQVEICVHNLGSNFYGETPCSDQPFFLTTTSNGDGNFVFENVPNGRYVITIKAGKNAWAQLETEFGLSEVILVQPGAAVDLGELVVGE